MKKTHRLNAILIIALTLPFGFTISVVSAAPPIAVTSAEPDEAEQGTTGLTVIINGRGFDQKMDVKFCRSETNETCEDGGVDVQPDSVIFISSKKLEVTVDVGPDAVIGNFDIEATSLSSRRRGRGIEKFAVLKVGGGVSENLRAKFDLTIDSTEPLHIVVDPMGEYRDNSKDHVAVFTGSGPGFRFDTNTQNISKHPQYMKARWVFMTVTEDDPLYDFEIDFRFNQTNGLDLGSLKINGSGTVAASLQYFGGNKVAGFDAKNNGILGFGALNAPNPTGAEDQDCLAAAGMITVTRTDDTHWTLESTSGMACRFAIDANGDRCLQNVSCADKPGLIDFKFKFTIKQQ